MNRLVFFLLVVLFPIPPAFAEDVVMFLDQQTYYFTMGENALIPLEIENNSGESISGLLQYTITQDIRQGNTQISSTNSNTSTLTLEEGKKVISLDFGSSNSPSTLTANLKFSYNNGIETNVFLGPIEIIFTQDNSQNNSSSNPMQSSSQQGATNNRANPQQSLQQRLDEMLNQSPLNQDPQQRLQNNQMAQDSNALKQQIQEQLQKDKKTQEEFEKHVVSNEEFQRLHQQMLDEGYELKQGSLNPSTNSTGTFEANYENQEGQWGKIHGSVENGELTEIEKQTQEEQENLISKLRNHPQFQEYENQLNNEGFFEQNLTIQTDQDTASIVLEYQNEEMQNASIIGKFDRGELKEIIIDTPRNNQFDLLPFLIIGLIALTIGFILIKLKTKKPIQALEKPQIISKKFDYTSEIIKLIEESKKDFQNEQFKEAYGKIGQAIRKYLSHKLGLKKEITNEELLKHLPDTSYPRNEIKKCLDQSALVEFAKNSPDENEFKKIITLTENLIKK